MMTAARMGNGGAMSAPAAPAIASLSFPYVRSWITYETDSVSVFVQRAGRSFGYDGRQATSQLDHWIICYVRVQSSRELRLHRSISWCLLVREETVKQ
jgi:hypothetical protein